MIGNPKQSPDELAKHGGKFKNKQIAIPNTKNTSSIEN